MVATAMLTLGPPLAASIQETGVLRITVALAGADGQATPIPRVVLLVSDNPATAEPRRVRTGPDGSVAIALQPGNYTIESDVPVTLGGRSYLWTETLDVAGGSDTVLSLTPANAHIDTDTGGAAGTGAVMRADSAAIFTKWSRSIVQIWTPTTYASGFLVDARGLIATSDRAIGNATEVEIEFTTPERFKIAGRVMASDRQQGVAIIWIDPGTAASLPVVAPGCADEPGAPVAYQQKVVTIVAPLLEPKDAILGTVGRVGTVFEVDWRLTGGTAGGPVFDANGRPIGITVADEERRDPPSDPRRGNSQVIPINNVCSVLAAAEKTMAGASPPPRTRLRVEELPAATRVREPADPKAPPLSIPTISSSNFDISLLTPTMVDSEPTTWHPRTDFGQWTDYVKSAPPVLLVRVTPQFEESWWKTILRGAAQTQGVALPPLKSATANFLRMRAFCGATEVAPIHPFTIERQVQGRASIREGLYVFGITDFGPHCGTVRFDLYSEKSPDKADSRIVDAMMFAGITRVAP